MKRRKFLELGTKITLGTALSYYLTPLQQVFAKGEKLEKSTEILDEEKELTTVLADICNKTEKKYNKYPYDPHHSADHRDRLDIVDYVRDIWILLKDKIDSQYREKMDNTILNDLIIQVGTALDQSNNNDSEQYAERFALLLQTLEKWFMHNNLFLNTEKKSKNGALFMAGEIKRDKLENHPLISKIFTEEEISSGFKRDEQAKEIITTIARTKYQNEEITQILENEYTIKDGEFEYFLSTDDDFTANYSVRDSIVMIDDDPSILTQELSHKIMYHWFDQEHPWKNFQSFLTNYSIRSNQEVEEFISVMFTFKQNKEHFKTNMLKGCLLHMDRGGIESLKGYEYIYNFLLAFLNESLSHKNKSAEFISIVQELQQHNINLQTAEERIYQLVDDEDIDFLLHYHEKEAMNLIEFIRKELKKEED